MKRVTVFTIDQALKEVAGDWVRIRTTLPHLHPIMPWNVDQDVEQQAVTMAHEDAQVVLVRRTDGGRVEDRYVAISRDLAELLIPALQPIAQRQIDSAHEERRLVARRLEDEIAAIGADLGRARDLEMQIRAHRNELLDSIERFRLLPWYKRAWRALRGRL